MRAKTSQLKEGSRLLLNGISLECKSKYGRIKRKVSCTEYYGSVVSAVGGIEERKMTEQERIIVSAYTGFLLCNFGKVHEYVEKKLGRPIWTHQFAEESLWEEIREKCKDDFVALADERLKKCPFCGGEASVEWKTGYKWVNGTNKFIFVRCGVCRAQTKTFSYYSDDEEYIDHDDPAYSRAVDAWNLRKEQ